MPEVSTIPEGFSTIILHDLSTGIVEGQRGKFNQVKVLILIFFSPQEPLFFLGLVQKSGMSTDKTELLQNNLLVMSEGITDLVQIPVITVFLTDLSHNLVIAEFKRSRLQKSDRPKQKPPEIYNLNPLAPWECLLNCEVTYDHAKIHPSAIPVHNIKQSCDNLYYSTKLRNLPGKLLVLSSKTPQHDLAHECGTNPRYPYNPHLRLESTIVVSSDSATLRRKRQCELKESRVPLPIPSGDMDLEAALCDLISQHLAAHSQETDRKINALTARFQDTDRMMVQMSAEVATVTLSFNSVASFLEQQSAAAAARDRREEERERREEERERKREERELARETARVNASARPESPGKRQREESQVPPPIPSGDMDLEASQRGTS